MGTRSSSNYTLASAAITICDHTKALVEGGLVENGWGVNAMIAVVLFAVQKRKSKPFQSTLALMPNALIIMVRKVL